MIQIIQKIFLSPSKIAEQNQKKEILQMAAFKPVTHHAYVTKKDAVTRRFSIKTKNYHIYTERIFDRTRPEDEQVHYTLRVDNNKSVMYATHSTIDKFAQQVYTKMRKSWEKSKRNAR